MKKKDTTFVTIGASSHAKSVRAEHDYYSTDPSAIRLLDKYDLLDKDVPYWETACGGGRLSKELLRLGYNVVLSSDKYDHGYGEAGVDFFKVNEVFQGNTITNPPFKHTNDWIVHTLKITSNKAYIFNRLQTIESFSRYDQIFKHNPPSYICPFVKRIPCYKNDDLDKIRSPLAYAWFIWDKKDNTGETKVKWLI